MKKTRLAFAYGGKAVEHEHSVRAALYLMAHANRGSYEITPLYVGPDGRLADGAGTVEKLRQVLASDITAIFGQNESIAADFTRWIAERSDDLTGDDPLEKLSSGAVDIVFPVFHGQSGEDALFQGVLDFFEIPYVGCGITGSAVGNDKELNKRICAHHGIGVADFKGIYARQWQDDSVGIVREIEKTLVYPLFVKPPRLGSSMGITKAYNRESLTAGIELAFTMGEKVIVERLVEGREYGVGLIGNGRPEAGAIVEFGLGPDYLDYEAKYGANAVEDAIPAPLPPETAEELVATATTVYHALDLYGMARIDFFLEQGKIIFNEANTVPGFGRTSVFSKMWEARGVGVSALIDRLVDYGFERAREKQRLLFDAAP